MRYDHALPSLVPRICLCNSQVCCLPCAPVAGPSYLGPRGGWIARRLLQLQYAVLAARLYAVFVTGSVCAVGMPLLGLCAVVIRRRAPLWACRRCRTRPVRNFLVASSSSALLGCSSGGGVSAPYPPLFVLPGIPSPLVATLGVSSAWGNSATLGVLMPCSYSTPPRTPWRPPLRIFCHTVGLESPLLAPHS